MGPLRTGAAFVGIGLVLATVYFPDLFGRLTTAFDDEGYYLTTVGQFLHHGSLYVHTSGTNYGPFYWSFIGLLFRLTGQSPTPTTGRLLVLGLTVAASVFFAGAVWRVSRDLLASILCQVITFLILVSVAGAEPISPGSTIALLLSVLVFALASYSVNQGTVPLVFAGMAVGALAMTKINIGIFAFVGLAVGLIVGNPKWPRALRVALGAGAVLLPFLLMVQRLSMADVATWACLVALSMLGADAVLSVDPVALRPARLAGAAYGFAGIVFVSLLWPLSTGTSLPAMATSVLIRPLHQVDLLTSFPVIGIQWISILVTAVVVALALRAHDPEVERFSSAHPRVLRLALATAAVVVLLLAVDSTAELLFADFETWLPAVVLLLALAVLGDVEPQTRLALRLTVPIAILQSLHAYPVAGSQRAWSTVVVVVPCAIALAAGISGLPLWRATPAAARACAVAVLCVFSALSLSQWPVGQWVTYRDSAPLGLPGTAMIRVNPAVGADLRQVAAAIKQQCDTFYSAPPVDTLYIYTGIPVPTGQLADWAGMLTTSQEQEVAATFNRLQREGKRVCVVRNLLGYDTASWTATGSEADRPIGEFIASYQRVVAKVGFYTVSRLGLARK